MKLARILTQTEILLNSDMLGAVIAYYISLLGILFVSFVNIYSVDEYEYLYNKQKSFFEFKHKLFFIFMYSKEKHIISKKTFITEIIGYCLFVLSVFIFVLSLYKDVITALILLGILSLIIFIFGCVTGHMYGKAKKSKNHL